MSKEDFDVTFVNNQVSDEDVQPDSEDSGNKKSKKVWLLIIPLIIIALIAAGAVFYMRSAKGATYTDAYKNVLTEIKNDPASFFSKIDGLKDYDVSSIDISQDEFCVIDTDGDSTPELIVNITSPDDKNSFALVYGYTEKDGAFLRGTMGPDPVFYTGGTVTSKPQNEEKNITLIEKYDIESGEYVFLSRYYPSDYDNAYCVEEYTDGDWKEIGEYTGSRLSSYISSNFLNGLGTIVTEYKKINTGNIAQLKSNAVVTEKNEANIAADDADSSSGEKINASDLKIGFIYLNDETSSEDKRIMDAAGAACEKAGVQCIIRTNIPADETFCDTAAELVESGCSFIFSDSHDCEEYMVQAATDYPDVQFCFASGIRAHTEGLTNYHNAYASIHEGRYLTGIAAGMKLNEMIENGEITENEAVLGFVGPYSYAEVISGYTAFYLGAKSVCPSVTMKVRLTWSWDDEEAEQSAAERLISNGCVIMSQYGNSMGVPTACEEAGVPDIAYNGSTESSCPNTCLISTGINWQPYFEYVIRCLVNGETIETDWTGSLEDGTVELSAVNESVAASGTQAAIDEAKAGIEDGSVKVFNTENFTVYGQEITSYFCDVDYDKYNRTDTEVIVNGQFKESIYRSAPYFDLTINGITIMNSYYSYYSY